MSGVKRKSISGDWMSVHSHKRTLALPEAVEHWSPTALLEKLIKIGPKIVRHGRFITFQMGRSPSQDLCSLRSCASLTGCGQRLCRHDGVPSSSIQVARLDRCALPRPGCALSA